MEVFSVLTACISQYKHERVMAELEAVMIAREVSKELIKEKFLLVAKCCTRTLFYA